MKQNFTNLSVLCFLGIGISAYGQTGKYDGKVGINTSMPAATLAVQVSNSNAASTTNEGILAPKLSKTRVANIANTNLAEGTLVYVTDDAPSRISSYKGGNSKVSEITEKGYYYYNGDKWVKATGSGTSGRDGASFLSGTKAPTNEGNNGDTYVNTKTGEVYTKSSNTWKKVSGASLKGPKGNDGSNGSNGNSMTSGSGTPSGGIDGDTYLDTNTGDVWRKASGNWAKTGTTLKGANGAPGAPGTPGTPGKQGKPGKPGRDGTSFLSGTTAPLNNKGNNGDTYVNIKTGEVYTKSSGTWTKVSGASLKGSNGSKGNSMTSGSGAPSGGIDGDTYLDTSTGEVWRKTSGSWAKTGDSLRGRDGEDGTDGEDGDTTEYYYSSQTVTIPKRWIQKNNCTKGIGEMVEVTNITGSAKYNSIIGKNDATQNATRLAWIDAEMKAQNKANYDGSCGYSTLSVCGRYATGYKGEALPYYFNIDTRENCAEESDIGFKFGEYYADKYVLEVKTGKLWKCVVYDSPYASEHGAHYRWEPANEVLSCGK